MSASRLPPPQWLEPCAPAQFSATLLNTGSGTATGTLQLNHQLGSSMLSLTVGGTVQPTTAPIIYNLPQGASLTVQYTMQVGCEGLQPLFANNGTLLPLLFTESATAGGASVQASYQVRYPFVVRDALAASNAGLFTTAHRGMVLGRTLEFSNDGLGAFNGTFLATATQGCQYLQASSWTASMQGPQGQLAPVNNINVTTQGVELDFAAQPWPAGWRLLLTEQVSVTGCLDDCPNGTANTAYAFNLSCTATTCLPLSPAGASVQRDNARPLLVNYRVQPAGPHPQACLPAGLDSSRLQHHRHHVVNTGGADAKDVRLRLSNIINSNLVNGNTFLLGNTVQFSHAGQNIPQGDTTGLTTGNPANYPACVQALVQAGHNPISRYDIDTLPWLAPGDSIVVDFYTYRCCPDTASTLTGGFDKPEYFDNWTIRWPANNPYDDECGGQGAGLSYDLQDLAAGRYPSDEPRARYLHLQQAFYPTVTQLLGPFTTGTCGTNPTVLQVQNMSFNAGLGEADGNHLFFGSNAGATPAGQLLLRVSTTQGLSFLPGTALLSDGNAPLAYTVQAAPQGLHYGTWEILFDLPTLFNDYAALKQYMENSSLYLPVVPCCPSGGATARIQAELVLLQGGGNCLACQVALSRVYHDLIIQCPGCVTPGVIVDAVAARRLNFGLVDANNDGLPDQPLATLQPGPGSTAPDRSMQGDTVRVTVQAFGQEGDAGNGGFTYAQWAQVHGESLRWLNLDLVNPCAWQDTFDWVGISDSLRVWQDNGWGNWIDLSTWRTRVGKQYQYRLPGDVLYAQGLLQRPHFKPGDQYEFKLDYRVCGNFHGGDKHQLACGITAICWWSGVQQGPNARGQRQKVGAHWSSLPDTLPLPTRVAACGLDLLYYCESNNTNHFNLGWSTDVGVWWTDANANLLGVPTSQARTCTKSVYLTVQKYLGPTGFLAPRDALLAFPGEYRPLRADLDTFLYERPAGLQPNGNYRANSTVYHGQGTLFHRRTLVQGSLSPSVNGAAGIWSTFVPIGTAGPGLPFGLPPASPGSTSNTSSTGNELARGDGHLLYTFVLDPAWGLAGTPSSPLCVNFVFDYMPGCNPGPTALPWLLVRGISFCGDTLGVVLQRLDSLPLAGDNCVPLDVQLQSITAAGCNGGGAITISASGEPPLQYSWTGPNGFSASTANIYNLQAGLYQLVLTDLRGCSLTAQYTVPLDSLPNLWLEANASCVGQQLLISVQGDLLPGYSYSWAGPNGPIMASGPDYSVAQASLQDAGQYSVTVSAPGGGCAVLQAQVQVWMNCCGLGYTEVGSLVGVPDIGTAIDSGYLLPHNQSYIQPQFIVVRGTFEFNYTNWLSPMDYDFAHGSEIIMDEGAEIIISNENSIHMVGTRVHGCTHYWKSITVNQTCRLWGKNNTFEGGEHAVKLNKDSRFSMSNSLFHRDRVGVLCYTAEPMFLANNEFGEQAGNLSPQLLPYTGMPPTSMAYTCGIEMVGVPFLYLGGSPQYRNVFQNIDHGIRSFNGGLLSLESALFENVYQRGIFVRGLGPASDLQLLGSTDPLTGLENLEFRHSGHTASSYSVYAQGTNLLVRGVLFEDVRSGVHGTNLTGCTVDINNNLMSCRERGVNLLNTGNSVVGICAVANNEINVLATGGVGIHLNGFQMPQFLVNDNHVNLSMPLQEGIWVQGVNSSSTMVLGNTVQMNIGPGGLLPKAGINVDGSTGIVVQCNNLRGQLGYSRPYLLNNANTPLLSEYMGYRQAQSGGIDVSCNEFENLRTGMRFESGISTCAVQGNVFGNDMQLGLLLSSGAIGNQNDAGNLWLGNNFDRAAWASSMSASFPNSIFYVSTAYSNPFFYPLNQGIDPAPWFVNTPFGNPIPYLCTSNVLCDYYGLRMLPPSGTLDSLVASGDIEDIFYQAEQNLWADKMLYAKLDSMQNLDALMQGFKDSVAQHSSVDEFLGIEYSKSTLDKVDEAAFGELLSKGAESKVLGTQILNQEKLLELATTYPDSLFIYGQRDSLVGLLTPVLMNADSLANYLKQEKLVTALDLDAENLSVVVNDYQDLILATANEIYLNTLAKDILPDSITVGYLESIVYQCPIVAGPGIYTARLVFGSVKDTVYQDEQVCLDAGILLREAAGDNMDLEGLSVYPNPTNELVTVHSRDKDLVKLRLLDLGGTLLLEVNVDVEPTREHEIDLGDYPAGLYLLKVELEGGELLTKKITIVR